MVVAEYFARHPRGVRENWVLVDGILKAMLGHTELVRQVQDYDTGGNLRHGMQMLEIVLSGADVRQVVAGVPGHFRPHIGFVYQSLAGLSHSFDQFEEALFEGRRVGVLVESVRESALPL